jgi:Icc-related predicted phosphoesterase
LLITCLSDTHRFHQGITIPECDVVVFAGDAGWEDWTGDLREVEKFLWWFRCLPAKYKVMTVGNHDYAAAYHSSIVSSLAEEYDIHYLINDSVIIDGIKFWASPFSLEFMGWSFALPRDEEILTKHWNQIPENTDVVITHGPCFGILDTIYPESEEHLGDPILMDRIAQIQPKLHVSGHIHGGFGKRQIVNTIFVNASVCDENYDPINLPILVEI